MLKRFNYYDCQWSPRRSRNVAGDIFEETLAKNFPKQKTSSHRIKKLYINLKQDKYKENHT